MTDFKERENNMKKEHDDMYDPKVQKILDKLISEEQIATDFYVGCIAATCPCQSQTFSKLFLDIAIDERDDHAKKLTEWAIANDYDVAYKFKDFEKKADKKVVKQFNDLKDKQAAKYYVMEAIKSEQWAIDSYKKALEEDIPYELHCILMQNYYDEVEHLEKLQTLSYVFDAEATLA